MKKEKLKKQKRTKKVRITSQNALPNFISFDNCKLVEEDVKKLSKVRAERALENVFRITINGKPQYVTLLAIYGIDIFHFSNDDKRTAYRNFAYATSMIKLPHKYIFSKKSPELSSQKEFLEYKKEKSEHAFTKALLDVKVQELNNLEKNHKVKLAYLMIFSNDIEDLYDGTERFCDAVKENTVELCNFRQFMYFTRNYINFTDKSEPHKKESPNDFVLPDTLRLHQNYFVIEDKYITSIRIWSYPAMLSQLTIADLVSANYDDVIVTWDVTLSDKSKIKQEISKSLTELKSRAVLDEKVTDAMDTQAEFDKLQVLYNDISSGYENMMYTTLRMYVYDTDLESLEKRVDRIKTDLDAEYGFGSYVPSNQMLSEYQNLCRSANTSNTPMPLNGTYSIQFPFYYQEHIDDSGMFMGYTQTDGLTVLNTFTRNAARPSYDLLSIGVKGGGKTITLKSLLQDQILLGNKVMCLDLENEYSSLVQMYNGQTIRMDRKSFVNPLQIRNTIVAEREAADNLDDDLSEEDRFNTKLDAFESNFTAELSRICTFMYQFSPELDGEAIAVFRDVLVETYAQKNITKTTDLSSLSPKDFPIFSDVLKNIERKLKDSSSSELERALLKKLEIQVKNLSQRGAYGSMFDAHTNVEIDETNLIVFDVKSLSEMDENACNAQLFNILSLMWSEICKNVAYNNNIKNPFDRRYVTCLIDEAHRFISTKNTLCTDYMLKLVRRTRKYDAALWFATQSILDFLPSDTGASADDVKKIFQLVQYKLILKQSSNSIQKMHETFDQFTISELKNTEGFAPGEMLLSLGSGKNKVHFRKLVSQCDLYYMGNSRDREEILNGIFNRLYLNNYDPNELAQNIRNDVDYFINYFTNEVVEYFGFNSMDSNYLVRLVQRDVKNLTEDYLEKHSA